MKRALIAILVVAVIGLAKTATQANNYRGFQVKRHNINMVECCVSNFGKFGQSESGSNAGCWWPKGTGHNYIYGAGPWFGTIDSVTNDTLVTIGYGPHGGEAEYTPGLSSMSSGDPASILYLYPTDWPPPADPYTMAPTDPKSHQDSWCAMNDLDIANHMSGDTRPIGIEVYQTVYAWNLSSTQDIIFIRYELKNISGARLKHCYFGVATDNDIGDEGGGGNDIIAGIVNDTFVITQSGITSTYIVDNLGYQWQVEDESGWDSIGAIGFDYLQSPYDIPAAPDPVIDKDLDGINDYYERDSLYYLMNVADSLWDVDGDGTFDWRDPSEIPQLGMSAFKRFTLNLEPNKDNERYITLAGYNFKTGAYEPFDTTPPLPDDQRFLQCSGPFELEADSIAIVLVGVMFTNWDPDNQARPDSAIAVVDGTTQFIYDMNWLLPGPPPPPRLTCIPGDAKILLNWDNTSETTIDPYYNVVSDPNSSVYDPNYLPYDFQGYRVWRSLTNKTGSWELLGSYDKVDNIVFEDTIMADSIALEAVDNGVVHSFTDATVRNGFSYYYAVTAFDYNYVKQARPDTSYPDTFKRALWFESGLVGVSTTPRRDPADYVQPGAPDIVVEYGNALFDSLTQVSVLYALKVDSTSPVYIEYSMPETTSISGIYVDSLGNYTPILKDGMKFTVYQLNSAGEITDSTSVIRKCGYGYSYHEFPSINGMGVSAAVGTGEYSGAIDAVDTVEVGGSYPDSLVAHSLLSVVPSYRDSITLNALYDRGFWAFRGNDYLIKWIKAYGSDSVNSVIVVDIDRGDTIPFRKFNNTDTTRHLGDGWCFTYATNFAGEWAAWPITPCTDTICNNIPQTPRRTRNLYIMGCLIGLNTGNLSMPFRPTESDEWIVRANPDFGPTTVCGRIRITGYPGRFATDAVTLNVKVVPNPYLVYNEWQQSSQIRKIRFINLPSECTIRIFTLNGELIKTLRHVATIAPVEGETVQNNIGGDEWWDLLSENRQLVASGLYVFHVQSEVGEQIGKFVVIR